MAIDPIHFWLALRLALAFPLAALAAVLFRLSLDPGPVAPFGAARLGVLAPVLLALLPVAGFLARGGDGAALAGVALLSLAAVLHRWRFGPTGLVWRALRADPDALRRMGVDTGPARFKARLLAVFVLVLAAALLAELASLARLLPLAALLVALLGHRLSVLLPAAAAVGALSVLALPAPDGWPALVPWLGAALLACLPPPPNAVATLG